MAFQFDLDAGRACLDFVNTLSRRSGDHLAGYADLLAFAEQSNLLTPDQARRLQARAEAEPRAAADVLAQAHQLRTTLFGIFSAVATGHASRPADLEVFNAALARTLVHAQLRPKAGPAFEWDWRADEPPDLEAPLWPVVRSAADVLTSGDLRMVRECGAADCAWLFLDTSKNRSRQWCSMQSCGNREKARRHYQRVRATRARR